MKFDPSLPVRSRRSSMPDWRNDMKPRKMCWVTRSRRSLSDSWRRRWGGIQTHRHGDTEIISCETLTCIWRCPSAPWVSVMSPVCSWRNEIRCYPAKELQEVSRRTRWGERRSRWMFIFMDLPEYSYMSVLLSRLWTPSSTYRWSKTKRGKRSPRWVYEGGWPLRSLTVGLLMTFQFFHSALDGIFLHQGDDQRRHPGGFQNAAAASRIYFQMCRIVGSIVHVHAVHSSMTDADLRADPQQIALMSDGKTSRKHIDYGVIQSLRLSVNPSGFFLSFSTPCLRRRATSSSSVSGREMSCTLRPSSTSRCVCVPLITLLGK